MENFIKELALTNNINKLEEFILFEKTMHIFAEKIAQGAIEFVVGNHKKVSKDMINSDAKLYIQSIK